jgi:hypothetical protein
MRRSPAKPTASRAIRLAAAKLSDRPLQLTIDAIPWIVTSALSPIEAAS